MAGREPRDTSARPRGTLWALAAACAAVLALGALLEYRAPWLKRESASTSSDSRVRISEVMTSNASAFPGEDNSFPDWIELENAGSAAVNLRGYALWEADSISSMLAFPQIWLAPGERMLIYADGQTRADAGGALHAPFRLSASGAALFLIDALGAVVDEVNIPELGRNSVYRRAGEAWEVSAEYTPGMDNTAENHASFLGDPPESPLSISELMASNATVADAAGRYLDYIEIHSTEAMDLEGYFLSDSADNPRKWRFPAGATIPADGYLVVYASGLDEHLHADFKLSSSGEEVILADPNGRMLDSVAFPALLADQAYSRGEQGFTTSLPPTPGAANALESVAAQASGDLRISEIMASPTDAEHDWLEIENASADAVDLSGWWLSDEAGKPRKWRFPDGASIAPGQRLGVFMAGFEGKSASGALYADFKLSLEGGYTLTLARPDGGIADRLSVPEQFAGIAYARMADGSFRYTDAPTPGEPNAQSGYLGKAQRPAMSVCGGLYAAGDALSIELTAAPGARIYYTLDCSDPDEGATPYTGPIAVGETTIVRARAYTDGMLPSYMETQSYFFGISHEMRVVSLVSDAENLQGESGIYTNYAQDWEREGHVEVYAQDGQPMLSENCGLKLHGADSRSLPQKNFKVIARNQYGAARFESALFSQRPYESYKAFILRSSSEDGPKTRMRDSVLTKLAAGTSLYYQETELCVVYINGLYWGHYNMRERITTDSICQFEGWDGDQDGIDLVRGNSTVMRGSDETFQQMLAWVRKNGVPGGEALQAVGEVIDLDNFITYHALQIFVGNADTLNVKRYRNANADGKWRWIIYDLDWGFYVDTNSISRWLDPEGMGSSKRTDNTLFRALMKNEAFRDRFLTFIGAKLATDWTTEKILAAIEARYNLLAPELPAQFERWNQTESKFREEMAKLVNYTKARPAKLIGYFRETLNMSDADMEKYFGDAMRLIREGETT